MDFAGRHEEALLGPGGPTTLPSGVTDVVHIGVEGASNAGTGAADAPAPHSDGAAPSAGTPKGRRRIRRRVRLRVSLVWPEPERPHTVQAHPDLLEAARWFVENNPLPRLSGFAACKERARYRCENPECWRLGLDHEAHHIQFCQHGGSDDPDNAVSVCRGCHGRSIHTGDERIRVTRVELQGLRTRLWEYTGRAPILQFLDLPPATPSLRAAA